MPDTSVGRNRLQEEPRERQLRDGENDRRDILTGAIRALGQLVCFVRPPVGGAATPRCQRVGTASAVVSSCRGRSVETSVDLP